VMGEKLGTRCLPSRTMWLAETGTESELARKEEC
jgi:hypothetical protein